MGKESSLVVDQQGEAFLAEAVQNERLKASQSHESLFWFIRNFASQGVDRLVANRPSPDHQLGDDWTNLSRALCVGYFTEILSDKGQHHSGLTLYW